MLKLGEKVIVLRDKDIPADWLPIKGYVVKVGGGEVWISSDPENIPIRCKVTPDGSRFFSLVFFEEVLYQTKTGVKFVKRAEPKGMAAFIAKWEEQYGK